MTKVDARTSRTGTPTSEAATGFIALARIIRPTGEKYKIENVIPRTTIALTTFIAACGETRTRP